MSLLVCLLLPACGYSHKPLFRTDVRTVAAPIFENRSFYRDVERDLSEALIKQLELDTPYKVTSREGADTILEGTIVSVEQTTLSRTYQGGLPQELEVRITADFEWKNARTGASLRQRRGIAAVGRYVPSRPVGEQFQTAQHAAVQELANRIVTALGSDW